MRPLLPATSHMSTTSIEMSKCVLQAIASCLQEQDKVVEPRQDSHSLAQFEDAMQPRSPEVRRAFVICDPAILSSFICSTGAQLVPIQASAS